MLHADAPRETSKSEWSPRRQQGPDHHQQRAPGSELLPPSVGSIDKLERPASFWTPLLIWLAAPCAKSELAPKLPATRFAGKFGR
jgi:hypothetical protein